MPCAGLYVMETHVEDYVPDLKIALRRIFARVSLNRVIRDAATRDLCNLSGDILDIGGGHLPRYWSSFDRERCRVISADRMIQRSEDIEADFEMPLPIPSKAYDSVVCFSTLEHVYNTLQLLREIRRVKKSGANALFWIPFFMQPHGTREYSDYFRFIEAALTRLFDDASYQTCKIHRVSSIFWVLGNLISQPINNIKLLSPLVTASNALFLVLGYLSRNYMRGSWPIGYFVIAT